MLFFISSVFFIYLLIFGFCDFIVPWYHENQDIYLLLISEQTFYLNHTFSD